MDAATALALSDPVATASLALFTLDSDSETQENDETMNLVIEHAAPPRIGRPEEDQSESH